VKPSGVPHGGVSGLQRARKLGDVYWGKRGKTKKDQSLPSPARWNIVGVDKAGINPARRNGTGACGWMAGDERKVN